MSEFDPVDPAELMWIMFTRTDARSFYLEGEKGSGKTSLAIRAAKSVSDHVIKVTLNDGDMAAKYEGFYRPKDNEFEFTRGLFAQAWTWNGGEGCPIVVDEVDHSSPEVLSLLYAFLDDPEVASLTLSDGTFITPGPKFRFFGTSNQPVSALPEPLGDRMEVKIHFDGPSAEMLNSLDEDVRKIARDLMAPTGSNVRPLSFRDLQHFCNYRRQVGDTIAAQAAVGPARYSDLITAVRMADSR